VAVSLEKTMQIPVLSIVTSTYNALPYLKETVESVCKLKINYEWLIYDNCSTDGTKKYLKQINQTKNRMKVFFNSKNLGHPFPNFAKGVKEANGQYLIFLDSDDILPSENAVKAGIEVLELNRNVHVAISEIAYMDEKSKIYKNKKMPFAKNKNLISGKMLFWLLLLWPIYPTKFGAMMIRKDLFEKTGPIFDIELILQASNYTSFAIIKKVGLNYRNRPNSHSSKLTFKINHYWTPKINKFLPNHTYFGLKYFFIIYKSFLHIIKLLYFKFTYKRF
jgi:glycosyltransferase involved in cell wall biosynthesis